MKLAEIAAGLNARLSNSPAAARMAARLSKSPVMARWLFSFMLFMMTIWMKLTATTYPAFRARLKEKDFTAQISTRDRPVGRSYTFSKGKIS